MPKPMRVHWACRWNGLRVTGLSNSVSRGGIWWFPTPYISASDAHLQQGDLPAEPDDALIGGQSGLESIEQIVEQAPEYLVSGGWLLFEHGFDQADAVTACMQDRGFQRISSRRDWSGQPRMTGGQWLH